MWRETDFLMGGGGEAVRYKRAEHISPKSFREAYPFTEICHQKFPSPITVTQKLVHYEKYQRMGMNHTLL